jgi:hypothetical protein
MSEPQKSPAEQSIIELVAFLFQIARSHQHLSLEALLEDAKTLQPDVSDEQWHRATVDLAHTLHKNDYMGFASDPERKWKPNRKSASAAGMDDGPT